MKLHKVLTVDGTPYDLVSDEVRLDLRSPGRASFVVKADATLKGLVTLDLGYNDKPLQRHFVGYVERCTAPNNRERVLLCREVSAILTHPLPMGLRHVNLSEVLIEVSKKTGLTFRVPEQKTYATTKTPYFYSLAAGIQTMDSLAQVFGIPDFVWQQQGDGQVFVGSWTDSFWGSKSPLQLPPELLDNYQNHSATVAALPGLRPGATLNQGERVTSVILAGTEMSLTWNRP
ncbi:hypothetical protein RHM65_22195 [Pseudomonas sp. CCI4.2]|uniref:hypothetical protein n=1 Tax=Pseudomonas sp. CCI4.2 TaxID=3048620 RepID=UPI002AC969CE|nr:hypothetical protein [Pseudomonas sp. CCI4.2]MEB0090083.1 hypothetical protein [Pseudomonas sp. CCI4.2]WPX53453.1 hypothetical protein RHM65_22195 [Pseudomonas sp. CCI4.2]